MKSPYRAGRNTAAIQENVEKLTGQRGSGLDRAITIRELQSLGLVNVIRNTAGQYVPRPVPPVVPGEKPVERPHAPEGFAGFGGFGSILLEWKNPTYSGHAYTEIWRHSADVLSDAVLIATTPATVFGDVVNPGSSFFYWARHVNVNNISGPYHNEAGIKVMTSPDIGEIIDDIGEQMESSVLIQGLVSDIAEGDKVLATQISETTKVLIDADEALASKLETVESTMTEADNELSGRVSSLQQTSSSADQALSERIDTTQASLNGVSSTVQSHSQTIAEINEDGSTAYQAMWNQKAQAGDIKAGIGILADSDGTSQVAVSASQFFVFDPNTENPNIQPLLAIDKGNVIIPKALIETATIQILAAQTIVADEVKAGISISTPTLTSATINGAEVNVGAGGPYNGCNTHISENGNLYTNYLIASGGRLSNLIIDRDCTVLGTIYANQIIGDVVKPHVYVNTAMRQKSVTQNVVWSNIFSVVIPSAPFQRTLVVPEIFFDTGGYGQAVARYYLNNGRVLEEVSGNYSGGRNSIPMKTYTIPANQVITFRMDGYMRLFNGSAYLYFYPQSLLFLSFK